MRNSHEVHALASRYYTHANVLIPLWTKFASGYVRVTVYAVGQFLLVCPHIFLQTCAANFLYISYVILDETWHMSTTWTVDVQDTVFHQIHACITELFSLEGCHLGWYTMDRSATVTHDHL